MCRPEEEETIEDICQHGNMEKPPLSDIVTHVRGARSSYE